VSERVSTLPFLPVDMDDHLRQSLTEIFQAHARQINWATGHDMTLVSTTSAVGHDFVKVDATASAVTVSLMPAAQWVDREIRIKKVSNNTNLVIVDPHGSEQIDGTACATLATAQYSTMRLISDGDQWWKV